MGGLYEHFTNTYVKSLVLVGLCEHLRKVLLKKIYTKKRRLCLIIKKKTYLRSHKQYLNKTANHSARRFGIFLECKCNELHSINRVHFVITILYHGFPHGIFIMLFFATCKRLITKQ
jgi:hypothetical protein